MKIEGIDHVEFYVADAEQSAAQLCDGYGFTVCGPGGPGSWPERHRSVLTRHGTITILFTSADDPGHPAARYVARHGDGPAVIAFSVADGPACLAAALRRGAGPASFASGPDLAGAGDTVRGFGDVAHRFVTAAAPGPASFASGPDLAGAGDTVRGFGDVAHRFVTAAAPGPAAESAHPARLQGIDHLTVCLEPGGLAAAARAYHDVFGFSRTFAERMRAGGQTLNSTVLQSPSGSVTLSLLEPAPGSGPGQVTDFLAAHGGPGIQRIAFRTPDIFAAIRGCARRGVSFPAMPDSYYDALPARVGPGAPVGTLRELGVLADRDCWGLMFQAFADSPHPRRTFGYQLVERRGALSFAAYDVPALCATAPGQS
jgi:4-hydroxymandelate synthase